MRSSFLCVDVLVGFWILAFGFFWCADPTILMNHLNDIMRC
jgi:hypothetical protein